MSQFKTREFKALRDYWYHKLKSQGFEDQESASSNYEKLIDWHSMRFQKGYNEHKFNGTVEYFQMAERFWYRHEFTDMFHKIVWKAHSEGFSLREIEKKFNSKVYIVREIINNLKQQMTRGYE